MAVKGRPLLTNSKIAKTFGSSISVLLARSWESKKRKESESSMVGRKGVGFLNTFELSVLLFVTFWVLLLA